MQSLCTAAETQDSMICGLQMELKTCGDSIAELTNELNFVTTGAVTRAAKLIQASLEIDIFQGTMESYICNVSPPFSESLVNVQNLTQFCYNKTQVIF